MQHKIWLQHLPSDLYFIINFFIIWIKLAGIVSIPLKNRITYFCNKSTDVVFWGMIKFIIDDEQSMIVLAQQVCRIFKFIITLHFKGIKRNQGI